MLDLLIATTNMGKLEEFEHLLAGMPIRLRSLEEWPNFTDIDETGETFEANAILKARCWAARTELWTIGDDSGLVVDALGGRPGIHTARYARSHAKPLEHLLGELNGVPGDQRTAHFVCVLALASPSGEVTTCQGILNGFIGHEVRGYQGFGFDPVFAPHGSNGRHLAEYSMDEKNRISHRYHALVKMRPHVEALVARHGAS